MVKRPRQSKKERREQELRAARAARARADADRRAQASAKRRKVLRGLILMFIWLALGAGGTLFYFGHSLPDKVSFEVANQRRLPSIRVMSVDNRLLAEYGNLYGRPVEVEQLPRYLINAVLTAEDRRFYDHFGVDIIGVTRALFANVAAGRTVQGGSTITQQVAKNLFLTPERTLERKIQEVMLAAWLEWKFTKDQILTLYLNRIYFGDGLYGIDAASRKYFGKHPSRLSVFESAVLAGMPKAPNRYNPYRHPERSAQRANLILDLMAERGVIPRADAQRAQRGRVRTAREPSGGPDIRYFTDWILQRIPDYIGYVNKDIVVKTTLDSRLQEIAEIHVDRFLENPAATNNRISQAALLALTPDGAIRTMIGGKDYQESQYNRVTQARRQAGSAFKLYVYMAGLQHGFKAQTWMEDRPIEVGDWNPRNFDRNFRGRISVRESFGDSVNSIAVQMGLDVGLDEVIATARKLGITTPIPTDDATITLGSAEVTMLELVGSYAVIANGGYNIFPYAITEITEARGDREVLYSREIDFTTRLVNPITTGQMNNLLAYVVSHGSGQNATIDRPVAGKTGTTSNNRDAWFIGYSADMVAGVWVGNDNQRPMANVTGGTFPAKLWRDFMLHAHKGLEATSLYNAAQKRAEKRGDSDAWKDFTKGFAGDSE